MNEDITASRLSNSKIRGTTESALDVLMKFGELNLKERGCFTWCNRVNGWYRVVQRQHSTITAQDQNNQGSCLNTLRYYSCRHFAGVTARDMQHKKAVRVHKNKYILAN